MKTLIFSTAYLPFIGGAEIAVKEITDRLGLVFGQDLKQQKDKIEFDLITARLDKKCPKQEKISNVNVYRIGFGSKLDKFLLPFFGFIKAARLNSKKNYDIVWSIMASQGSLGASFFKIFFPKKFLLLTLQEGDEEEHLKRYTLGNELLFKIFVQPLHRLVIRKADRITAISQSLKERAIKSGAKGEITIVPNGVDFDNFQALSYETQNLTKERHNLKNNKLILSISRLVKKNGLEDLIKGAALLNQEYTDWNLVIVGEGELEEKLKKLAEELGITEKVIFAGKVPYKEVVSYYKLADVFIRPSLSEGLGNVFLEAMAAGVPVIATPVGGIKDFLKDNENGLFCEVNNPPSIKDKILKLLNDDQLKNKLIENGKRTVKEKFEWSKIAESMKKIFFDLVNKV